MQDLLNILIPLILAILYFVGGKFFGGEESEQTERPRPQTRETPSQPSSGQSDRERQIQDEIRRRIAERQRQREEKRESHEQRDQTLQERYTQREETEAAQRQESPPTPVYETQAESFDDGPSWFEQEAERRRQEIEATQRRAEQLRKQAGQRKTPPSVPTEGSIGDFRRQHQRFPGASRRGTTAYAPEIQAVLSDPDGARKAFLYQEILGTPVGLRDPQGGSRPLWEQ
ncbi:MAG: hypothetical protein ACOCVG_00070 [Verrucomicrobiota bacterium]